jgi:mRNA interferase RelE/StbE
MTYELEFDKRALKEWRKLDNSIQAQFKKHLARRLIDPHVRSARLHGPGMTNMYKIKLRESGYRLVYEARDSTLTVRVVSVGKRDKGTAYDDARDRITKGRTRI